MRVYYYRHLDIGFVVVCCRGLAPGKLSPVWEQINACVFEVPETIGYQEEDE